MGHAISSSVGRSSHPAIIYESEHGSEPVIYTFGQLDSLSNRLSSALRSPQLSLPPESRIGVLMSQSPETAIVHAAILKSGFVSVPLFVLFGPEALEYRLNDCAARVLFVEPSKKEEIMQLRAEGKLPHLQMIIEAAPLSATQASSSQRQSSDIVTLDQVLSSTSPDSATAAPPVTPVSSPALIIYTSGTTGAPKGALHSHSLLLGHLPGVELPHDFFPQPRDRFWTPADWAWIGGLMDVLFPSLYYGVPVVAKRFKKFDPEQAFQLIAKHSIKNMFLPPTALKLMRTVDERRLPNLSVRSIGSGGESLGESLIEWGRRVFGLTINEFYGQTECNLVLGNSSVLFPWRSGSIGKPIPGAHVDIVNEAGEPLPTGAVGNIAIKGPHPCQFLRYWNNPKATKEKFAGDYLLTGDLGKRDSDGYFFFVGRSDDVIKSAGYRIGPSEIENCILQIKDIQNCAVVGVPDPKGIRGDLVAAICVLSDSCRSDPDQLRDTIRQHVQKRLAHYEYPRVIEFIDKQQLPMTNTGKIIRKDIRKAMIDGKIQWKPT